MMWKTTVKMAKIPTALILILLHAIAATPPTPDKGQSSSGINTESCIDKYLQASCNIDISPDFIPELKAFQPELFRFSGQVYRCKQQANNFFENFDETVLKLLKQRASQPDIPETDEEHEQLIRLIEPIHMSYCSTDRQKQHNILNPPNKAVEQSVPAPKARGTYAECIRKAHAPSYASEVVDGLQHAIQAHKIKNDNILHEFTAKFKSAAKADFAEVLVHRLQCFLEAELDIDSKRRRTYFDFILSHVNSWTNDQDIIHEYTMMQTQIDGHYTFLNSFRATQNDLVKNLFNDILSKTSTAEILLTADDRLNALFYTSKLPANQRVYLEQFIVRTPSTNNANLEELYADYLKCFESKIRLDPVRTVATQIQKAMDAFQSKKDHKKPQIEEEKIRISYLKRRKLIALQTSVADELAISAHCYVKVESRMEFYS